jgi:hypothetical protein
MGELGDDELQEALMVKQSAKRSDLLQVRGNLTTEEGDSTTEEGDLMTRQQPPCALGVWVVGNS